MKAFLGVGRAISRSMLALMLAMIGLSAVIAPSMANSALAAQKTGLVDDSTYVSDTSGEEITWTGTWEVDEESTFSDTDVERLALTGDTGLLDVIWFPAGLDLASTRDELFDILTDGADDTLQVDRGDYQGSAGKVSYSLDKVLVGDTELAMFTLLMERKSDTFVTVFYSTPDLFADGMGSAQKSIKDDGAAIFQGIEPDGLSTALDNAPSLLDGASSSKKSTSSGRTSTTDETETPEATEEETSSRSGRTTTDETETPEATEESTSSRSSRTSATDETETPEATEEDSTGSSRSGSAGKKTADETETPESDATKKSTSSRGSSSGSDDFSDVGVISDGVYESPLYGAAVEWTDAWVIDESADVPVSSDADSGTDEINFVRADYDDDDASQTYGALTVRLFEAGSGDTPESVVEYWTSEDYLNGGAGDGSTVLLSDATKTEGSVILIETLDSGDILVQYLSVFFLDRGKTAVMIEFYATDLSIADAYADVQDGITVDGSPILTLFDARDIEDALAEQ